MTIALEFLLIAAGVTAFVWFGSIVLQGFLYNEPAERLGLRAGVCGLAAGAFLALWAALDAAAPGRYVGLFEFTGYDLVEYDRFTAVREYPGGRTEEAEYVGRGGAGPRPATFRDAQGRPFTRSTSEWMVTALLIPGGEGGPGRFELRRADGGGFGERAVYAEVGGDRYADAETLGVLTDPQPGKAAANVALNLTHLALWFVLFWPVMRFQAGHAVLLALGFWAVGMELLLPLLFEMNR